MCGLYQVLHTEGGLPQVSGSMRSLLRVRIVDRSSPAGCVCTDVRAFQYQYGRLVSYENGLSERSFINLYYWGKITLDFLLLVGYLHSLGRFNVAALPSAFADGAKARGRGAETAARGPRICCKPLTLSCSAVMVRRNRRCIHPAQTKSLHTHRPERCYAPCRTICNICEEGLLLLSGLL